MAMNWARDKELVQPVRRLFIFFFFFNYFYLFIYLAALGLHCRAWAFSSCGEQGLLFIEVRGPLSVVASRCGAQAVGTQSSVVVARGLSSCGSQALERRLSSCGARA